MNYDSMSIHELLDDYAAWHETCVAGVVGILADIESALRKAVIREASVGVGTVRRGGDQPLPDAPQMFVPWETKDGDYDLIPHKETP